MNTWGIKVYGNPCRECGFEWAVALEAAAALIADVPKRYYSLLEGQDGTTRHPELAWSVGAYVCHVADNLRIWAERMWSSVDTKHVHIEAYDQDAVASSRGYEHIPVKTALWSLSHSAKMWREALAAVVDRKPTFNHPERGLLTLPDIVQSVAHDATHHEWDIGRSLAFHQQTEMP